MTSGAGKANRTGQTLEKQVERLIMDRGYRRIKAVCDMAKFMRLVNNDFI